jgi:hypothetical protein
MKKFLIALFGLFLLFSPAKAQLTQAQVTADINSMLTSCGNGCNTAATLRALLNIMGQATFFPATVQMLNAFPQPIVDLQTSVPTNGFYTSGSGAIYRNCPLIGCISGDHQRSALYLKSTATFDASIAEYMTTFDCNLNSGSTGTPVGPGGFSNAKVCVFNSSVTGSSAGNETWAQANDLVIGAGDTGTFKVNTAIDITNNATNCAVGVKNCYGLYMSGLVANPVTAFLAMGLPVGTVLPAAHYGLLINHQYIADTADIEESGGAPTAICIGCLAPQTHSVAVMQDFSTSPIGIWLRGTYATDAFVSNGFSVNGSGQVGTTSASTAGTGFLAVAMSNTATLGVYFSNGTPTVTAANGSIDLDTTGKLWARTGGAWTQVTVP